MLAVIPNCPKSPGNKYGVSFGIDEWLFWLEEKGMLTDAEKRNKYVRGVIDPAAPWAPDPSPKKLPQRLRDQFFACVPDAKETKEVWATEPEVFMRVAHYTRDAENSLVHDEETDDWYLEERLMSRDDLYLTEAGAKVFNAIKAQASEITYSRR